MALANDKNQGDNLESTNIENVTGIENSKDLSNLDTPESKEKLNKTEVKNNIKPPIIPSIADNAINKLSFDTLDSNSNSPKLMTTEEANSIKETNKTTTYSRTPAVKSPIEPIGDFLTNMASISKPDTAISKPINQDIDYSKYEDYLPKNKFYYDNNTQLDKSRALNQSNWEQAAYATGRTLVNVVPEAIKQVANALDVEDWSNSNNEVGNFVADAITQFQDNVKDAMPIYRENPNESLDVGDFAYWMETGESLVTSIGGFVLAGYALGGLTTLPGKVINAAAEARSASIAKKVADGIRGSSKFQKALSTAQANQVGARLESLSVNFLMNQAESVGIGADVYKNVYESTYNNAIVSGKSEEEAKKLAQVSASKGAAASINFNRLNMLLNTSSSDLFLKSPTNLSKLIKKEGLLNTAIEGGKEGAEEYINDLGQIYGENLDTNTPLTFKKAIDRLGTAEGLESPILGVIGGVGQTALTKAGKYIQTSTNESYMRHFNQYLMENPITETNKESSIQAATAYAQAQASKDKPIGLGTNKNPAGYTTSTAQQLDSLYVAQQSAVADYDKSSKEDKLNDIVNSTISAEFSANLMNQIKSDPTLSSSQKNNLLERALLSHQVYKASSIGTTSELKNLYKKYAEMDEEVAKTKGILNDEKPDSPEYYKNKANNILKTIDIYENNYNLSRSFINSTEVYDKLNNSYLNERDVKELEEKYNKTLKTFDELLSNYYTQNNKTTEGLDTKEVPVELQDTKIKEELDDLQKAITIAKQKSLANTLELQKVTSDKYTKELAEYINLYRNKQIAEKTKKSDTKRSSISLGNIIKKKKNITDRVDNLELKQEEFKKPNTTPTPTTVTSLTGNAQPTTTVNVSNNNTSFGNFDVSDIKASSVMQQVIDVDTAYINETLNSKLSLDTKINKIKDSIENKVYNNYQYSKALASDGEEVTRKFVTKLEDKLRELEAEKVNLSPEEKEANDIYDSEITDFALDLEEDNFENPAFDEETEEKLPFNKEVLDAKYDIYSSILETMGNRGIDITNYEDVMTEFVTVLGSRLVKSQYNSLQALFNLANNTNESRTYKDLFDTIEDTNNDLVLSNKLAKVTLPSGVFVYDIDEESRIAMQNTKQNIILNNPSAEVNGIAYPIYNETGSNVLAYLSQAFNTKAIKRTTEDGKVYYEVKKVTKEGQVYYEIDKGLLSNLLNTNLDFKILEDNYFNIGDEISFIPLESYTDDNGNIVLANTLPVEEKPIGVIHNGELINGLYLHNVSWITAENINNTPDNIELDRANLINLRNRIINGEQVTSKITEISKGAPITNPNEEDATFLSQFEEFPVGIIQNGELVTTNGNIPLPEYLHFNEGSVVIKVKDYFYYGSRTRLFQPMQIAIVDSLRAFALGEHNEGTKALQNRINLNTLTNKGLENYISKLVNTSSIKINNYFPEDLNSFKDALNTRPEDEVYINFIKGDFYIGRGQGLDVYTIKASEYKGKEDELNDLLVNIKDILEDSFANASLENLKSNNPLLIINQEGIDKEFPTYDNYIKQVSVSPYGSIVLPSGNKITTIQKRINFDLPLLENKTDKLIKSTNKNKLPKKIESIIKEVEEADDLFSDVTDEDLSPDIISNIPEIQYTLKVVNILNSNKSKQVFEKGNKNNWSLDKILTELQIPKKQKQLTLDLNKTNREEIITDLLANYSYTIEINTTKNKGNKGQTIVGIEDVTINENTYRTQPPVVIGDNEIKYFKNDERITKEEYNEAVKITNVETPTKYYSNLTVPGGTNYTENEIATPAITPSIKGHAQFATDNGIGWFRSDEQTKSEPNVILPIGTSGSGKSTFIKSLPQENLVVIEPDAMRVEFTGDINDKSKDKEIYEEAAKKAVTAIKQGKQVVFDTTNLTKDKRLPFIKAIKKEIPNANIQYKLMELNPELAKQRIKAQIERGENRANVPDSTIDRHAESYKQMLEDIKSEPITPFVNKKDTKTRRILEVQSDLFQKNRDNSYLIEDNLEKLQTQDGASFLELLEDDYNIEDVNNKRINNNNNKIIKGKKDNQFLQLLNKDNNWVTFFIKSIIQNSAKKDYEKVLFPTGNTASKIEGHTTLEEFKKQKEDRIKELEKAKEKVTKKEYKIGDYYNKYQEGFTPIEGDNKIETQQEADYLNREIGAYSQDKEINQLKEELERVETEGFGALKPIYNFYENTVTNILNKTYSKDNVKVITDEYGNTWNEINIENVNIAVDLSPNVEEKLTSPHKIEGLSNAMQETVVTDIVQDYYALHLESKKTNSSIIKLEEFFDAKTDLFDVVVLKAKNQNYKGYDKLNEQVNIIKANKSKILEIVRLDLTRQLGVIVNSKNVIIENTNDNQNPNEENVDSPDGNDIDDATEREKIYDQNEFSIDPKLGLSNEIKYLLYNIVDAQMSFEEVNNPTLDNNGKLIDNITRVSKIIPRKTALQIPVRVNANVVYQDLIKVFSKSSDNAGMNTNKFSPDVNSSLLPKIQVAIQILESLKTTQPYYANVINKIKELDLQTQLQFVKVFNKNNTDHIKIIEYSNKDNESLSLEIIKNSTQNATKELIRKWDINLKSIGGYNLMDDKVSLSPVIYNAFTNLYNGLTGNKDLQTYPAFQTLFKVIGIELSLPAFEKLRNGVFVNGKLKNLSQQFEHSDGYLRGIKNRLDFMMETDKDGNPLYKDIDIFYDDNVFKQFANFLKNFDKSTFTSSYKNSNGDTIWGVTNNRYFMERLIDLKNNVKLLKNLNNNPFSSTSTWLSKLYNKYTASINTGDFVSDFGYETIDSYSVNINNKAKLVNTLDKKEFIKMSLSLFFNNNKNRLNGSIPIHKFIIPALSDKSNAFIIQAQGRLYNMTDNKLSDIDLKFLRSQLFEGEFLRILNNQNKKGINIKDYNKGASKFLMLPEFNNIKDLWINGNINEEALTEDSENNNIEAINEVIMDYITDGLNTNYNKWEKLGLLKKGKENKYSDKMIFIDKKYSDAFKENPRITMEEGKGVALNYTINYLVANANMQQLLFNDPAFYTKLNEDKSVNIENTFDNATKRYAAVNGGKEDFQFPSGSTFSVLSIEDTDIQSTSNDYLSQLWADHPSLQNVLKSYSSIENGDAQEYTSLEEHLDRMVYNAMIPKSTAINILKTYKETGKVNKVDLDTVLIPFKPLYFNTYMGSNGIMETLYIKTSSLPLIKEFTNNTQLDILRDYLENPKNKVKVAVFASGIKAGNPIESVKLFDKQGNIIPEALKGNIDKHIIKNIPREGHGNQQDNPDKSNKSEINDGTQQAKLSFTNILDVLGFKNPLDKTKEISGRELSNMYLNKYEERFKIQYQKLIKELDIKNGNIGNIAKLKKILSDEAISKGWTFNETASFELDESGLNFDIPLWQSISSSKIENLLSSIVDNRIRKRKRFGRAYILASDAGIRSFNSEVDSKNNGITFLDTFKGELKNSYNDNGVMTSADILVPFRFFDNNGKLLNIKDFINKDGNLDTEKLPIELLQGFGFRIPTSGINLMSNIRVVGFLPESYGDVVIAPADFTKQMGSDFDVDKFYTNTYATFYNEDTNSLEKLTTKHIEERKVIIDNIFKLNNDVKRLKNYKGKTKVELLKDIKLNKKIEESKSLYKIKNIEILVIDNEILDIQRSILDNPSKEVQRARTKPLSFGRLEEMIQKFANKVTKDYYTFLDRNVQDDNYISGNLGKTAVGNFSLDMILNSLGQYSKDPLYFQYKISTKDGYTFKPVYINTFGFKNNNINDPFLNDGSGRYKSDVLEGLMAAALDNGKEKILGKLNVSDSTFDFIRAMIASGYNEEVIMGIINQPVVKMYLDSVTNSTVKNSLLSAVYGLKKTSTNLANYSLDSLQADFNMFSDNITDKELISIFNNSVKDGVILKPELDLQLNSLALFLMMEKNGQALAQVRSALNVDSTGVGKNIVYSAAKLQQADSAMNNTTIANVGSYFNGYTYNPDTQEYDKTYSSIGQSALTYGVSTNVALWSKFFPFNNLTIQNLITDIGQKTGKDIFRLSSYSDYASLVLKDLKSFLSAKQIDKAVPVFMKGMEARDIYKSIIYSSTSHESLGEFIQNLRDNNENNIKYTNDLLNSLYIDFKPVIQVTDINPAIINIQYSSVSKVDNSENKIVNSLIEMINEPVYLGTWNNNAITSKDLGNLLILHQFYSKGVPSSTKFIQYIPTTYLKQLGYYSNTSKTFSDFINPTMENNLLIPQFKIQHLQHNMKDYYDYKLDNGYKGYFENGKFTGKNIKDLPSYIVFREDGKYHTQYKTSNGFIRLNPLGWGDNTEYDLDIMNPTSLDFRNNSSLINVKENKIKDIQSTKVESNLMVKNNIPFTAQIDSTVGERTIISVNNSDIPAYPIQLTQNGTTSEFYLTKKGNSYNNLYHPITNTIVPIEDLAISNKKIDRDINLINSLSILPLNILVELGLTTEVETINIKAIEENINDFMTITRDKSEDVFPDEINNETRDFADELGLTDKSLNLQDRYALIFNIIQKTNGKSNPILRYFLSNASTILPIISTTPIILDYNLKAKGMYKSTSEYGYIAINPSKFNTIEDMASVVAEEAIHALFKKQVKNENPITKDLENLRKEVEDLLIEEYGQEFINSMKEAVSSKDINKRRPLIKGVESDLIYSILNLDEFIAAVLTKPKFQEYLNNKEIKLAKKTLWTKLLELLSGLLNALGVKSNTKLADAIGGILALTDDIRNNHLANLPKPKYERSISFINEKFNLVSDTNELSPKGNASEIANFINENFAGVKATIIEKDYVEVLPLSFNNYSLNIDTNLAPDDWSLDSLEFAGVNITGNKESNKNIRANYYQYASSLRSRIIQGEKKLRRLKAENNILEAEKLNEIILKDKVDLMSVPKLKNLTDFALKAKEDLDTVNNILSNPMNSEDIVYSRNILNFWKDAREYTFTAKHKESVELMNRYSIIEDEAKNAITKLQIIEKNYLNKFVSESLGRDIKLDEVFKNYKDINSLTANVRDISTYDNELLSAIWKEIQVAGYKAEEESEKLLNKLNNIIDNIMPKLKSIDSSNPYEIFRQKSENALKTNHLINVYSTQFYKDKSKAFNLAKESQTSISANNYANWTKINTKVINLSLYFDSDTYTETELNNNRETLKNEIGEYSYNLWFNGQNRKINSYNKRKEAIEASIKSDYNIELSDDISNNSEALLKLQNWDKKHSPFEFNKIINSNTYKYYEGSEGIDGFQYYEVLPKKEEHFNKDFEIIANDSDLLEFYNEFSEIYEDLKKYVPSSQLANLMFGGLPVIEKSIYQMYSTDGMKVGFKALQKAWTKSITSTYKNDIKTEFDLVTEQNAKQMHIPGITSNSTYVNNYVNSKAIDYEIQTGKLPTSDLISQYREEAVNFIADQGDFDLGKLMKIFSTLVIGYKHKAAIEDMVKIAQYTINSYQESEFNIDGSKAFRNGGAQSVLPINESFVNMKKALTYTINNTLYGEIKEEEGRSSKKLLTPEEKELKNSYVESLLSLQTKYDNQEVTEDFYNNLKDTIETNIEKLGSNIVASKVGDNWLKAVQLKLMGWNLLGGFSNSAFGFISNMIEASGEGSFNLDEMRNAYKMATASIAKNLTFNKWEAGESGKIRNAMDKLNVLKEASHELYTSNDSLTLGDKFKFASPYNLNQRTEYLNQAPIMIIYAKKTIVDTKEGKISLWDGMNENWEWNTNKYGVLPEKVLLDMRIAITKQIQRLHGNYDPASPLMIKQKFVGRALSQFRTWLYESVAVRFEKERIDDGIQQVVKGRYRTLAGIIFENEGRLDKVEGLKEFSKAMVTAFTFGKINLEAFKDTNLSKVDEQNMRKIAMELVLLLDVYILIALLKAGLSDDDEESKAMYNVLLNQGTRLKSDLLLYVNPNETRNILKDIIPSVSLWDDTVGFLSAITKLEEDEIQSGVHKGNSRIGTATMKLIPGASKLYSTYNSGSQIYDKTIDVSNDED